MKSLVLFDTNYGNTKEIAMVIAGGLGEGVRAVSLADLQARDLEGIGLLVAGSPIIGWQPSERMLKFLAALVPGQLRGVRAATFDTRVKIALLHGDAARKIAAKLRAAGASIVSKPQAFRVRGREGPLLPGEIEKAAAWARELALHRIR